MSCPKPFLNEADFPRGAGDFTARFCSRVSLIPGNPNCCLPCPAENWFYSDRIRTLFTVSEGVSIAGLICCAYLLLSYACLPVEYTGRHYLSVSLVIACFIMTFGLVIPLLARGPLCADLITPHDMKSSLSCAFSGAMLVGGGWAVCTWAFMRTLNIHLQICWRFSPGKLFFYGAQMAGWGSSIVFVVVPLSVSGLAYRFGDACHIRSSNSLGSFWGPLLALAATCIVLQFITIAYCIKVYIVSLMDESTETHTTGADSVIPRTQTSSVKTLTARQTFRRIKKVLAMQWRGICLILIVLGDVVFLATIFLGFNAITERTPENARKTQPWLLCMVLSEGNKNECLQYAKDIIIPESTAFAMLFLLSCNGIWAVILLGRWATVTGWIELFRRKMGRQAEGDEFVSYNAALSERNPTSFEMLAASKEAGASGKDDIESVSTDSRSGSRNGKSKPDYEEGLYGSKVYKREYPKQLHTRFSTGSLHTSSQDSLPKFESLKATPAPAPAAAIGYSDAYNHHRTQSSIDRSGPAPYHHRTQSSIDRNGPGPYSHRAQSSVDRNGGHRAQSSVDRSASGRPWGQQPSTSYGTSSFGGDSPYGIALGSPGMDYNDDDDQPRGLKYPPHARYF